MPSMTYKELRTLLKQPESKVNRSETEFDISLYLLAPSMYAESLNGFIQFLEQNENRQLAEWRYLNSLGVLNHLYSQAQQSQETALAVEPTTISRLLLVNGFALLSRIHLPRGLIHPEEKQYLSCYLLVAAPTASEGGTDLVVLVLKKFKQQAALFQLTIPASFSPKISLFPLLDQLAAGNRPSLEQQARSTAITGKPVQYLEYHELDKTLDEPTIMQDQKLQQRLNKDRIFQLKLYWQLRLASTLREYKEILPPDEE